MKIQKVSNGQYIAKVKGLSLFFDDIEVIDAIEDCVQFKLNGHFVGNAWGDEAKAVKDFWAGK